LIVAQSMKQISKYASNKLIEMSKLNNLFFEGLYQSFDANEINHNVNTDKKTSF